MSVVCAIRPRDCRSWMTLIGLFQKKLAVCKPPIVTNLSESMVMARIEKPLFSEKRFANSRAAVRVDVVFVPMAGNPPVEICGDIGGGINNIDVGVFGCQFPDACIGFPECFRRPGAGFGGNPVCVKTRYRRCVCKRRARLSAIR